MFRIGELATATGLSTATIRYYEELGVIPAPPRSENGYRLYSDEHVERITFIQQAKQYGFQLTDIRAILMLADDGSSPCQEVETALGQELIQIEQQMADLAMKRDRLLGLQERLTSRLILNEEVGEAAICPAIENGASR